MQRYESYKPSGMEWLGDIPDTWDMCRNIGLFKERKEINQPDMELLSVTINRGVIRQEEITEKKDSSTEDKSKYKVVRKDDLAYNKMRMWQGAIGRSEYEGIVSPAYVILAPRDNLYSRYYHYLYRTEAFIAEANRHSYGLCLDMNSLRYEDFKTIYSPVPPRTEVERIIAFLDQKNAEIDAAITKKERLIELLAEQKSILISNVVTRGLSTQVDTHESGVAWLGKIPTHWNLKPLKRLVDFIGGGTPNKNNPSFWDGDIPWISPKDMKLEKISRSQDCITDSALKKTSVKLIPAGAVLVVVRGMILSRTFPVAVTELPVTINQDMKGLIPKMGIDAEFLRYVLSGQEAHILDLTEESGHGTKTMPMDKLGGFPFVIPPLPEQVQIRNYCGEISESIGKIIGQIRKQLTQLHAFKATLVAASVSGKAKI